jgi:Methyltransferase domain
MITIEEILADPPKLHVMPHPSRVSISKSAPAAGELINKWKLSDEELRFIAKHIGRTSKTLETGAGCSTVVFTLLGAQHTCIVPDQPLADRILNYCREKRIPTDKLKFIIAPSEQALPSLQERDFDLALIDGRHGFPQPFLDWYYVAQTLKTGGHVIIDDLHVWVCEILMSFLLDEPDWKLVHESLGGCVFQKLGNRSQNSEYDDQRYVIKHSRQFTVSGKIRYLTNLLRRKNYTLLSDTLKLGLQSAVQGRFGERPKGRR